MTSLVDFKPRAVQSPGHFVMLAGQFVTFLMAHNYARNTVLAYRHDLEQFVGFCAGRDISYAHLVSTPLVEDFVAALVQGEGNSPRSAGRKMETVKRFYAWAVNRQLLSFNPAERATPVRWCAEHVIAPASAVLLRVIESIPKARTEDLRDRALLRLIYDAGMRPSGVIGLDLYNAERPSRCTVHPDGRVCYTAKGGRAETSVVDSTTLQAIDEWLATRWRWGYSASPPALFLTRRGGRMTRVGLWQRVRERATQAGVDKLSPKMFRHRRAFEILEGAGPRAAQMQLGHRNLSTTLNTYGHEQAERLRAKVRMVPVGGAL